MYQELYKEIKFYVRIDTYCPARPAPPASNHDSPAYSDPGDDEDCEFTLFIKDAKNQMIEVPDCFLYDLVAEDVFELARDIFEGRGEL